MSFPIFVPIGPLQLHPHPVFEVLAYLIGFRVYLWRRRRMGDRLDAPTRWWIVAAAILGAAVGSRALSLLEDPAASPANWRAVFSGGKTLVGALAGGLVAVEWAKRLMGIRRPTGDLFAIPIALGIAIGRIGCFLTGLDDRTFGTPSSLPWAVDFGDGVPRHPVQLYESLVMVGLALALSLWERRPRREGDLFKVLMAAYMAWRLLIDALKPEVRILLGLSAVQLVALAVLMYYAQNLFRRPPQPTG